MTPAAHMQAAILLMEEIDKTARPADAIISSWFRSRRMLEEEDKGIIFELIHKLMRHRARLGWWLERLRRNDTPRNRLLVWLCLRETKSPDQIDRLFSGARFAPEELTEREYNMLHDLQGKKMHDPAMPEDVRLECPYWAAEPLRRRFGAEFETEMRALLSVPSLDVRVNTLKTDRQTMLRDLKSLGIFSHASRIAPQGIRIREQISLSRLPALKTGEIEIQDEGSQLVATLVDAKPGERVVDFCAGAGGKTLAIAAQMKNKGQIIACDVNEARLKRGAERMRHAGVHNAQTRLLSSESDKWVKRHKASYDRVLVDAPCSGTGTWRRNPDARWRSPEEKGLENLVALQARILASAARLVKPGGRLVYATCSLLVEENEAQITAFLAANPHFRLMPLHEVAADLAEDEEETFLSLTPARHDTDGFFAAVMQREALPEVEKKEEVAEES